MSFFKNLFKKKEGGTFFGNLIRKVTHTYKIVPKDGSEYEADTESSSSESSSSSALNPSSGLIGQLLGKPEVSVDLPKWLKPLGIGLAILFLVNILKSFKKSR